MNSYPETVTYATGSSITINFYGTTGPAWPPYDDPPAGVPARTGPRPSAPPVLAYAET